MKLYPLPNVRAEIIRPGMPLKSWIGKQEIKPFALINASLYHSDGSPIGIIIEGGKVRVNSGTGFGFGVRKDGEYAFGTPWEYPWDEYLTGYTGIVQHGTFVPPAFADSYVFDCKLNRIGIGERNGVLQIVVDDNVDIYTFGRAGALNGLQSLVNLDGGGSRYLWLDGKTVYTSTRTPYNAIAFYKEGDKESDMTNAPLVSYTKLSPNCSDRTAKIDTITIHHMACAISVESCGAGFALESRRASSNYGIDSTGKIALYVPENKRSWCSSNTANDNRAVTIEVANSTAKDPWPISDAAYDSLIELVTDICKRNGIEKLVWSDDVNDRIQHRNGCNMTVHRDYAATLCPGPYLMQRMGKIAEAVNARLSKPVQAETPPEGYDQWLRCWEWHKNHQ